MRNILIVSTVLLVTASLLPSVVQAANLSTTEGKAASGIPVYFEPNLGQTAESVKFMARMGGASLFLTPSEAIFSIRSHEEKDKQGLTVSKSGQNSHAAIHMAFIGANPKPKMSGLEKLPGKINYFIGKDKSQWRTNIPIYTKVRYEEIYPDIDLVFYTRNGHPEYDFELSAGTDPDVIRLGFQGQEYLRLDINGNLIVTTALGDVIQPKPIAYQNIDGKQESLSSNYQLIDDTTLAITVEDYDKEYPLRIDPEIIYSTYLGGSGNDIGHAITVDDAGYAYVAGFTASYDLPTTEGAYGEALNNSVDGFVAKMTPDGGDLVYLTYLGGSGSDYLLDVEIDATGRAHVVGYTLSVDFPLESAFQTQHMGSEEGIVAKLSPDGTALVYSSYLGGSSLDRPMGVAVDNSDNAFVTGRTNSESDSFPITPDAFQSEKAGGYDGFVAKIETSGALDYCTYQGGSSDDFARSLALDDDTNAYIIGETASLDFPVTDGAYKTVRDPTSWDAFVTKFSIQSNELVYSTYLGGDYQVEWGMGITVDENHNAYAVGITWSPYFPTTAGAWIETDPPGNDAFIAKLNTDGSDLMYASYIGGSSNEIATSVAVDGAGNAVVTGWTYSPDLPLVDPVDDTQLDWENFIVRLNPSGTEALFSSYLGGSGSETPDPGWGWVRPQVELDNAGSAYIVGATASVDFLVTPGAFQETNQGGWDAYVTKIRVSDEDLVSPQCRLVDTGISLQGTKQIELEVQDLGLGLSIVDVIDTDKMTVDIDPFTAGTTSPVTVMVTKINESGSATARLSIEDVVGNVSPCDLADVAIGRGPGTVEFDFVTDTQDQVSLINGEPGLKKLDILANDETFPVQGLRDDVYKELDISSALIEGDENVVTLKGKGRTGQSCAVLVAGSE